MKRCSKCNTYKKLDDFYNNRAMRDGLENYCKVCSTEKGKVWYSKNKHKKKYNKEEKREYNKMYCQQNKDKLAGRRKKYGRSLFGRFLSYRNSAKKRKIEFLISVDDFSCFWNKSCEYCGAGIQTIGLDRRDSNLGYVLDNILSCCEICNRAKLTLNFNDWKAYLEQISKFQKGGATLNLNEIFKKGSKGGNTKLSQYKCRSKKKRLPFELDEEYFRKIMISPCNYCGRITPNMGVDRVDNDLGYLKDNCVPCCKNCNSGKRNNDYEVFMKWVFRITQKYGVKYLRDTSQTLGGKK